MEETYTKTRICKLCGKTITYKVRSSDGYDWCGHQRGSSSYEEIGNECKCTEYKRMCLNCKYYNDISGVCKNSNSFYISQYILRFCGNLHFEFVATYTEFLWQKQQQSVPCCHRNH